MDLFCLRKLGAIFLPGSELLVDHSTNANMLWLGTDPTEDQVIKPLCLSLIYPKGFVVVRGWFISSGLGNRWQHADPSDGVPLWNRYAGYQKGIPDHVREIALLLH